MHLTAQSYVYRKHKLRKNCPYSDIVATESRCKVASDLLGLSYDGAITSTTKPAGCYWSGHTWGETAGFNTIIDPSNAAPEKVIYGSYISDYGYYGGICMALGKCYDIGSFTHSVCI